MHMLVALNGHGWHPAAWRVSGLPPFAAAPILDMVRTAERGQFDAALLSLPLTDSARPQDGTEAGVRFDPLPLIGAAIGASRRIGLAAYWPLDIAEPFHVARVFATLDHLSGGRTAWITGLAGSRALREAYGYAPLLDDPGLAAERSDEFIDVVEKLWDSWEDAGFVVDQASGLFADPARVHPIDHAGRFFTVRGPLNVPRPVQGRPVLMHRDTGPGQLRAVAAARADLVLCECSDDEDASAQRAEVRRLATHAGRDPDAVAVIASIMPILAPSSEEAHRRALALDALGPTTGARFVGTPAEFADHLAAWHRAGACDGFVVKPGVLSLDLAPVVEHVLPDLRSRGLARAHDCVTTLRSRLRLARPDSRFAA